MESIDFGENICLTVFQQLIVAIPSLQCKKLKFKIQQQTATDETFRWKPRFIAALRQNHHIWDVSEIDPDLDFFTAEEKREVMAIAARNRTRVLRNFLRAAAPHLERVGHLQINQQQPQQAQSQTDLLLLLLLRDWPMLKALWILQRMVETCCFAFFVSSPSLSGLVMVTRAIISGFCSNNTFVCISSEEAPQ